MVITSDAEYKALLALKTEVLKAELAKGFDSLDRGETSPRTAKQIADDVLQRHQEA